ncbi:MAG: undecaprenyl/decaprenyl-phosphate alpha-N-acetylglucosaminyl 1-phosphate transferase [Ignavibacteriaceae bacterium]|nr:undecaprenyl/decaprenyl-phosphate alpha-N-acetylglucosaminyl 1-phosphate transferase [Ignavibacteriaceae bacterium]
MTYIAVFFISLFLTIFFTPYLISYLKSEGILDKPEERKVHKESTPRMGGLVIFIVFIIILFSFYTELNGIRFMIMGMIIITICGVIDDIIGLKWSIKFIVQFLAALFLILFLSPYYDRITIFGILLPSGLDMIVLFLFIVGVINSVNLMDGMDGLVSGFALMVFITTMALSIYKTDEMVMLFSVSLAGALFGFLKFNAYPARIFLGDTGSLFLGFVIVMLSLKISVGYNKGNLSLGFPILLLAVPILDTLKVMIKRITSGKNPFLADNNHLHHIIFYNRIRHKTTVFFIQILALCFMILAIYYLKSKSLYVIPVFILLALIMGYSHLIFQKLNLTDFLKKQYEVISKIPSVLIQKYSLFLLGISSITIIFILLNSIKLSGVKFAGNESIFLIISGVLTFVLAYAHNRKSGTINHIYFFLNIVVFFFITHSNSILMPNLTTRVFFGTDYFLITSYIVLVAVILLFLMAKDRIIPKEDILFSGIDLTMIVVIALGFIVTTFLSNTIFVLLSESLLVGFIMYLWYKIVGYVRPVLVNYLFYGSFLVPMLFLIYIITMGSF